MRKAVGRYSRYHAIVDLVIGSKGFWVTVLGCWQLVYPGSLILGVACCQSGHLLSNQHYAHKAILLLFFMHFWITIDNLIDKFFVKKTSLHLVRFIAIEDSWIHLIFVMVVLIL